MKLIVDMNLSPRWIPVLVAAGFSAEHWSKIGPHDSTDATIMSHAVAQDAVVVTHDLDFGAILAATQGAKPSVLQIRADDLRPEVLGASVINALQQMGTELHRGALVTVEPHRARLRLLPLD